MRMLIRILSFVGLAALILPVIGGGAALGQMPRVHDPSTVVKSDGQYYVFTTGAGMPILSSPDGVNWLRQGSVFEQIPEDVHAAVPKNNGKDVWAPDVIRLNGEYYVYYAVSSWGSFVSAVGLVTNPTLNAKDPRYKWTDRGVVVRSVEGEDLNAIDPGVIFAPDGTLWICYGSYHGNIELVQLNPKTGLRISPKSKVSIIASKSEASDIIFHEGYYYLFVNHGSCCKGKNSQYTIRVGRSRKVTGPYLGRHGDDLRTEPGSLFLAAEGTKIGPGHFGRLIEDGVERFSLHYEADLENGGRSTLGLRPLLWSVDGWPVAGENLATGSYQLRSKLTENILEPHTEDGTTGLQQSLYLAVDSQKWNIAPTSGGFYKIVNAGNGQALQVGQDGAALGMGAYSGADSQMWRLDQFPDGGYRITAKTGGLALAPVGGLVLSIAGSMERPSAVGLSKFSNDDRHKWVIAAP
jgi:arabinan endo-1,5-alpha-L-arabinosidase